MSEQRPINTSCQVVGQTQTPLNNKVKTPIITTETPLVQMPVILAERTIQIVVESNISLDPPAFTPISGTDYNLVTKAKLFLQGFIRKSIEYVYDEYNIIIHNSIVNVPFSGSTDLIEDDFLSLALIASSSDTTFHFIYPKNGDLPHLEKCSFGDTVYYNKQPYCELISTQLVGLDFSPCLTNLKEPFNTFHEIIVLNLNLKVLQIQQVQI